MNTILFAFVSGAAGFHLLTFLPHPSWLLITILLPIGWRYHRLRPWCALSAGFLWSFAGAAIHLMHPLPASIEGRDIILTGVISSIPVNKGRITRFEMEVSSIEASGTELNGPDKIRLSWYEPAHELEPGQQWRLKVRLKQPRGLQNPAGFDYEGWLFRRGIKATGYIRAWDGNQRLDGEYHGAWLHRFRQSMGRQISQNIQSPGGAALIRALAIGDRDGMSAADWEMFSRTGTNHLVAISGLHIGMVSGLIFFLGQWFWRRCEWLTLRLPARQAGAILALIAAVTYAALAGFSLPTQRALVMLGVGMGALLCSRTPSVQRSFLLALLGVILLDPMAPLAPGFWLSFGAVAVILVSVAGRKAQPSGWRAWGRIQWAVALGLAPLLFYLFGKSSLIAPLVNLLLVPWFSLVLVPLILGMMPMQYLPLVGDAWLTLTESLVLLTLQMLSWCAELPFALIHLPVLPVWVWGFAAAGVLLLLLPKGLPGRSLGLLLTAPMLLNQPEKPQPGAFWLILLDVGQGLSCVVETAEHVMVYDTGPVYASGFNAAEAAIMPYLHSRGINHIDQLIVSNGDHDHAGGMDVLMERMKIRRIISGERLPATNLSLCRSGDVWEWDGVTFSILHPAEKDKFSKPNDASCVLKVEGQWGSLLIPGDVEKRAEAMLVERHAASLQATILIAPHHGSNTSSSSDFVHKVAPAYVLFPTGYRNRFGFPKQAVVARWQETGAKLLDTATTGAIQFRLNADWQMSQPMLHRDENRRYWSHNTGAKE